ncbi:MAG TPA: ferredoxin [Clostridiales bacterium]|nr:ferredoxin [Clostridiales bacterium]
MRRRRKIVQIDEELCDGCGLCITPCAEGALEIVDGKAKVVREELCDGAGFCLGVCPKGALTIVEREAEEFDEEAVREHRAARETRRAEVGDHHDPAAVHCFNCGADDADRPLLPVRRHGRSEWVCVRCLPGLIHG